MLFKILTFLLLLPLTLASLGTTTYTHDSSSSFTFVTFEKPAIIATTDSRMNSSFYSSAAFDFVTFKVDRLDSSSLLHSSKSSFDIQMNFTNRTNITLTLILPSQLFEGQQYDLLFVINNTGNQNVSNITFSFSNYSLILGLSAKQAVTYTSSFTARNGTLINASITYKTNSTNTINKNASSLLNTKIPLEINSIDFLPEQFEERDKIKAITGVLAYTDLNATIYYESQYLDFMIKENQTKEFTYNITACNNTNFTIIIDTGRLFLISQKKIETGLLPDLTGEIYSDELVINTPISTANFTAHVIEKTYNSIIKEQDFLIDSIHRNKTVKLWNATSGNTLIAYIDYHDKIIETNETNNKAEGYAGKKIYIKSDNHALASYAHTNLRGYAFVQDEKTADIILGIGSTELKEIQVKS